MASLSNMKAQSELAVVEGLEVYDQDPGYWLLYRRCMAVVERWPVRRVLLHCILEANTIGLVADGDTIAVNIIIKLL